jgi:hypothetical protein
MPPIPAHLQQILSLARWAPSGDNTQPWRFEILGDEHILVHGFDTRDHVVYDRDGHASQLAIGALLETIAIAATTQGRRVEISRRPDTSETHLVFDIQFTPDSSIVEESLAAHIKNRVVQRRPMSTKRLTADQKATLTAKLPSGFKVVWYESLPERWRMARFMFDNAKVRLTIPEGFEVHSTVIEWNAQFSEDKIPDQAVGVDPLTAKLMRWVMGSWSRVEFFNKYLLGDLPPRIQLDLLPGIFCSAHFALLADKPLKNIDDYLAAGRAMQRFWLTATELGLFIQPEMTPVIFTRYHRQELRFTQNEAANQRVNCLNQGLLKILVGHQIDHLYFMGRLGTGPAPRARSTRRPLADLIQSV